MSANVWIVLLAPALVSMSVRERLGLSTCKSGFEWAKQYVIRAFCITWLSQIFITYILGIDGVLEDALKSFPFFTKYSLIALVLAVMLSLVEYWVKRVLKFSVEVGVYHEDQEEG